MSQLYLERYGYPKPLTTDVPSPSLRISIVIPCYNEPDLLITLQSLRSCTLPGCGVEVLVVINDPEFCDGHVKEKNQNTYDEALEWANENSIPGLEFLIFYVADLPAKHAGVGLARKIGMDEAVRRFARINLNLNEGIIVCLDADSTCLPNYLQAIEDHFEKYPETPGCAIHYEHPLSGPYSESTFQGIAKYELYLRYYVHALRYAGFPFAYQTIGSSMAVRLSAYVKQGGMNRKKAGEDFYFLHKIIPLGNFTTLTSTTVIPSPRVSDRVPFGTGKAMGAWVSQQNDFYPAYNPETFIALQDFFDHADSLFEISKGAFTKWLAQRADCIQAFLIENRFYEELMKIQKQSPGPSAFKKKLWEWLNAFRILKFVHFSRDHYFKDIAVEEASKWLVKEYLKRDEPFHTAKELLFIFRDLDKLNSYDVHSGFSQRSGETF